MKKLIALCCIVLFVVAPASADNKKQELEKFLKKMEADYQKWSQKVDAAEKLIAPFKKEYLENGEDYGLLKMGLITKAQYDKKWVTSGRKQRLEKNLAPYFAAIKPLRAKFKDEDYQTEYLKQEKYLIYKCKPFIEHGGKGLKHAHDLLMQYELASMLGYFPASKITNTTIKIENPGHKNDQLAREHHRQSNKHYRNKDYDRAILEISKSIELQSDNPVWYAVRADYLVKKKAYDNALASLKRGEQSLTSEFANPKDKERAHMPARYWGLIYKGFAKAYRAKKEYDTAVSYYEKALEKPESVSDTGEIHLDIAKIHYYNRKDYEASLKECDRVLAVQSEKDTKVEALRLNGRSYKELGNPDAALKSYRAAVPLAKGNQRKAFYLYLETGKFLSGQGKFHEGLAEFDKAYSQNKMRKKYGYEVYIAKGNTYTLMGDFSRATEAYKAYGKVKPKSYGPSKELAVLKLLTDKKSDLIAAKGLLEDSYKLSGNKYKYAAFYLYYVKSRLGEDGRKVIKEYRKQVNNDPKKQLDVFKVILGEQSVEPYVSNVKDKSELCWNNYYAGLYYLANHQDKKAAKYLADSVATGMTTERAMVWAKELLKNTAGSGKGAILLD